MLFIAVFAVYAPGFGKTFLAIWDDQAYVVNNVVVKGVSAEHIGAAFTGYFVGNYAPMHLLSYMVDHSLWGLQPDGFFAVNILLHGMNGLLLYRFLHTVSSSPFVAAIASLIFLFHPVQVESVAWISQRKNVLALFFFLSALDRYSVYRLRGLRLDYVVSVVALCCALLTKSVTVIFPVVAVLYDLCFLRRDGERVHVADKVPYAVAALVAAVVALASQAEGQGGGRMEYPGGTPLTALYTMLPVLASYLKDCFFPAGLSPYYVTTIRTAPDSVFVLSLALFLLLGAFGRLLFARDRRLFFFYALFFIGLIPVSQIVPIVTLKNDRYLYCPLVGFAGFCALSASFFLQKWRIRALVITVLLLLPLPILSARQAAVWRNDLTLWRYTVANDPENLFGWLQLCRIATLTGDGPAAAEASAAYDRLKRKYGPLRGWEQY